MPLGLIGLKLGHTRVYDSNGVMTPVTVVHVGPNRVLQVKKAAGKDGYNAVQLAYGDQKTGRITKPVLGHLAKFGAKPGEGIDGAQPELTAVAKIREFRDFSKEVKTGDFVGADVFAVGQFVDCIGVTKGRGFEGVVARWAFRGGDMTHGAKGWHRRSGAIGQRLFPGTVRRGLKMPGHMGQVQRTSQNLEVVQVRKEDNIILVKGNFPGSEGDYCVIREAKKISIDSARLKAIHDARKKAREAAANAGKKDDKKAGAKKK
ncbi:MAG TPA: 50S ribosomal protein L3 [Candidatus Limnocylindria bacterium]|jgi:large subunit ribosomal protein L3|nr:50S ribosomal protein L3 [Candidatus Limnocylindria bacterium]